MKIKIKTPTTDTSEKQNALTEFPNQETHYMGRKFTLNEFPRDLLGAIFKYLDLPSLGRLTVVSRGIRDSVYSLKKFALLKYWAIPSIEIALRFLQKKIDDDEKNNESKRIYDILKESRFLLPYLAKFNPEYAMKIIEIHFEASLHKMLLPKDCQKKEISFNDIRLENIPLPFYFLLSGLANLPDQTLFLKVLEQDENQLLTLLRLADIQLDINPQAALSLIRKAEEFKEWKTPISIFLCIYARKISQSDYKQAESILEEVLNNYETSRVYKDAYTALCSNPAYKVAKGLDKEDPSTNNEDFEDWICNLDTDFLSKYPRTKHDHFQVDYFVVLFNTIASKSTIENVKKLLDIVQSNTFFLIDFLHSVDLTFFKSYPTLSETLIENFDLTSLSINHIFKVLLFKIKTKLPINQEDLSNIGFSSEQNNIIFLERLKNDVTLIQKLIKTDMTASDYDFLLLALRIVSEVNLDYAFSFVASCELPEDKKHLIRALLGDFLKKMRLNLPSIHPKSYLDEEFHLIAFDVLRQNRA